MIQGMLETDEFADNCVVAAVGTWAFGGELLVKIKFGSVIDRDARRDQSCATQTWSRDSDKTSGDGVTAILEVLQALKNSIGTGQARQQL
jgi:hypothetical protein